MSTIKTAIALYDGVTSPLKSMMKAMNIVISSFEAMQTASENAVDTRAIAEARDELAKAAIAFDSIEESINKANSEMQKLDKNLRSSTVSADGLLSKLAGLGAAIGGAAVLQKAVALSDTLSSTRARLNLIVDDGGSVEALEQKIMASANRSRAAFFDTASAVASMGANAKAAFSGNDELIAFLEQVNKQFAIGGASAQGQAAAMLQLTQAMAAGALRGEELNSILENAPGIARAIEQYMGAAEGSIKSYAEQGLITAEVVKNAMFAAADETNAKFESMPMTWGQVWTNMQNRALTVLNPLLLKLNEIANSEQLNKLVNGALRGLSVVVSAAETALNAVFGLGAAIVDNWSWIAPIVMGVAAVMGTYQAIVLALAVAEGIKAAAASASAFAEKVHAASLAMSTGATFAATAAQHGLNAALLACPITWIVVAIIALIAVFYAAVAAVNHFAGTSVSATGIICGAVMAAAAFIGNILVAAANLVIDAFVLIWNWVAMFANFLANVFTDPIGAVVRLFADFADIVLGILEALASAIDTLFGSNLAGAVQGWRGSLSGLVDKKFGAGNEIMQKLNAEDLHLGRFEYGAAYELGYNFGQGIDKKVGGLFGGSANDFYGLDSALSGIAASSADTAANTAAAADALEIAEEDLQFMRDLAEREAINRYTTAEVRIEQNNTNYIDKDTDLDGLMERWTSEFAERMDVSGESVPAF